MRSRRGTTRSVLLAAALVGLAAVSGTSAVDAATANPLKIVFPTAGAVINQGHVVQARFRSARFVPNDRDKISFTFTRGGVTKSIRGPAIEEAGPFSVLWNTSKVAGGTYTLRAKFKHSGDTYTSAAVKVVVNSAPSALITGTATGIVPTSHRLARKIEMNLDSNATDLDGQVTSIEWDFGDGTTQTGGTTANHQFTPGTYKVSVTVTDNKGSKFVSLHDLTVTESGESMEFELKKTERCGCKSMRIKTEGQAEGDVAFDSRWNEYVDLKELGPHRPTGTQLDLNQKHNTVACRFEVVAELLPGSAPWKCGEGIRIQASDDVQEEFYTPPEGSVLSSDPRFDSQFSSVDPFTGKESRGNCGYGGSDWCDGGYHGGGNARGEGPRGKQPPYTSYKSHDGSKIYMLGQAGGDFDSDYIRDHGGHVKRRYHAKISGPDGTCECTWDVIIEVDKTGMVTRNEVTNVSCTNG